MKYVKRKSQNLYADFETTSYNQYLIDGFTRVYLGGVIDDTEEKPRFFGSIQGFFNHLLTYANGYTDLNIYFHNLAFDVSFILYYLNDIGYTHYIRKDGEFDLPSKTYDLFMNMQGQVYTLTVCMNGCRYNFKDSLKKLPTSIKALGKMLGLNKLDETHDYTEYKPTYITVNDVPQEELDYLTNDILILRKAIQEYSIDENFSNTLTSSSASYNTWIKTFLKDFKPTSTKYYKQITEYKEELRKTLPIIENDDIQQIINKSYRGGITFVNPKFQNIEVHGISYDVNSLYPFSMVDVEYPCGQPKFVRKYDKNKLQLVTFFTPDTRVVNMIPFIPIKKLAHSYEYKEELPAGIYTLWNEEFELFKQYYNQEPFILSIVQFDSIKGMFDDYVYKYFELKATTKDQAQRYMVKLRLNGLGGKFGTKTYQIKKRCVGNVGKLGGLKFEITKPEVGETYYRAISSRMTSHARCTLIRAIAKVYGRFIYCDTDSMYLYGYEEPTNINIHPTNLGAFKKEHTFQRGKFLHTKCYVIEDNGELIHSIAGCSANAKQFITLDNFATELTVEKANLKALQVVGGVVLAPTDFTIQKR